MAKKPRQEKMAFYDEEDYRKTTLTVEDKFKINADIRKDPETEAACNEFQRMLLIIRLAPEGVSTVGLQTKAFEVVKTLALRGVPAEFLRYVVANSGFDKEAADFVRRIAQWAMETRLDRQPA